MYELFEVLLEITVDDQQQQIHLSGEQCWLIPVELEDSLLLCMLFYVLSFVFEQLLML